MFEALPHCDVAINIEKLSESQHYHANTISALKQLDLQGLDFSDCRVPMAAYGEEGEIFFREIEEQVHKIMTLLGYCQRTIERIRQMRFDNVPQLQKDACGPKETIRDAVRARSHARQYESELNSAKIAAARLQNTERRATDAEVRTRITEAEPHEEKLALNAIMPFTPGASLLLWAGP